MRHFEVDLGDSGLVYHPGDSLALWPRTPPPLVEEFLTRCHLDGDQLVQLSATSPAPGIPPAPSEPVCPPLLDPSQSLDGWRSMF